MTHVYRSLKPSQLSSVQKGLVFPAPILQRGRGEREGRGGRRRNPCSPLENMLRIWNEKSTHMTAVSVHNMSLPRQASCACDHLICVWQAIIKHERQVEIWTFFPALSRWLLFFCCTSCSGSAAQQCSYQAVRGFFNAASLHLNLANVYQIPRCQLLK